LRNSENDIRPSNKNDSVCSNLGNSQFLYAFLAMFVTAVTSSFLYSMSKPLTCAPSQGLYDTAKSLTFPLVFR